MSRFPVIWAREFAVGVGVPLLAFALFMLGSIGLEELGMGWVAATVVAAGVGLALIVLYVRWSIRRRPRGALGPEEAERLHRTRRHSSALGVGASAALVLLVLLASDDFEGTGAFRSLVLGLILVMLGASAYGRARERQARSSRNSP